GVGWERCAAGVVAVAPQPGPGRAGATAAAGRGLEREHCAGCVECGPRGFRGHHGDRERTALMVADPNLLRLLDKLVPQKDGEPYTVHRTAVVNAVNSDGTVDLTLSGVTVPRVPVLGGAGVWVGGTVSVSAWQGALLVLGGPDRGYPFVGDDPAQVRRIRWDGIASVTADTTAQAGSWIGWTSGTSSSIAGA